LQSAARPALHRALDACMHATPGLAESKGVRCFVEVDPQDLF
jgi:hypothetical protein